MKSRIVPLLVFCVSLLAYFVSTERLMQTVHFPTGDEPYYLLIAHSLVHDGDLELTNNFEQRDYLQFYPGDLFPRHEAVTPKPHLVSKHAPGLALLIAPAYAVWGWAGAAHTLNVIGALLALNVFWLARDASADSQRIALALWVALAFAVPFFPYAELVFPEAPAALLIAYAYRHLREPRQAGAAQRLLVAACLAALPWLHARFLFVAAGLGVWMVAQVRTRILNVDPPRLRDFTPGLLVLLVSAVAFIAYHLYVYDSPFPNYGDHSGTGHPLEIAGALFGVWLDQQWGLLNHAPVYLLAIAGAAAVFRTRARTLVFPLLVTGPYFVLIVQYRYWWGEWCPPARYLAPILPLLVVPLAQAAAQFRGARFRFTFAILAMAGWFVAAWFAWDARLMYNHPLGKSALLNAWGAAAGVDLTRWEPSYIMMFLTNFDPVAWAWTQIALTAVWIAGLAAVAAFAFGWAPRSGLSDMLMGRKRSA